MFTINLLVLLITLLTVIFSKDVLLNSDLEVVCYKHLSYFIVMILLFSVVALYNGAF